MHDPIGFGAFWSFPYVKDQSFFYAYFSAGGGDHFVCSRGFPVA